jgi:hypothetical protein
MLQFLVRSKARRLLLALLWVEEARGSVSELAQEAGLAFATTHKELKGMRQFGLARVEQDGRRNVYVANFEHPQAEALQMLLRGGEPVDTSSAADETTKGWLKALGVPLRVEDAAVPAPSLSEVLLAGVRLARRDPTVARALPLGFWAQRDDLVVAELLACANRPEQKHALGFFLELAGNLGGDRRLVGLAEVFRDRRLTAARDFFRLPPTPSRRELSETRTPEVARRWGFRMNLEYAAFESIFEQFADRT